MARQCGQKSKSWGNWGYSEEYNLIGWPCGPGWRRKEKKKRAGGVERLRGNLEAKDQRFWERELRVNMDCDQKLECLHSRFWRNSSRHWSGKCLDWRQVGGNEVEKWFSNFRCIRITRGSLKCVLWGLTPRVSDSIGLGWGRWIYISNRFSFDADVADLKTTLWEPLE